MKLIKSLILSLVMVVGLQSTAFARDITLSMWTHNQLYVDYYNSFLEDIRAEFPDDNINFDFQVQPDHHTSSLTAIGSGTEHPDLFGIEISGFGLYMADDIISDNFLPLTDMYGDMSQWNPGKVAAWTHSDGEIYAIESEGCYIVYYYQPAIFEKYGVGVPETWDEFMETGKILAKDGVSMWLSDMRFTNLYQQAGGRFFNEDGDFEVDEDKLMMVLKFYEEAYATGVINYTTDFWGQTPGVLYKSGEAVGSMMPDWYNNCCLQPAVADTQSGQWRVAPIPKWTADGYKSMHWGGTGFAIHKTSEAPDVAKKLLEMAYFSYEGQIKKYEFFGGMPTLLDALNDPRIKDKEFEFYGGQKFAEPFITVSDYTADDYQHVGRAIVDRVSGELMASFASGDLTAEETFEKFVDTVEAEIDFM